MRTGTGDPFFADIQVVSPAFLQTLGVHPMLGRDFEPNEVPPAHKVPILSHAAWRTHFGADPGVIERTVQLGENTYRIIGVMGPSFVFPDPTVDAWRPMAESPALLATRAQHFLTVVARIKPGVTQAQAAGDLDRIAVADQQKYPQTNDQRGTTMVPLREALVGDVRSPMYYLGAVVGLLLLIACANVANLMLAQASGRRREIAIRAAVGADRFRIIRQLLMEGVLLALVSGAIGIALAWQGTSLIARLAVDYVPRVGDVRIDLVVLAFAAALALATGIVFALVPAIRASRPDVQLDLRDGGRGSTSSGRTTRNLIVVVQFAAAVVLVLGAALLLRSFWRMLDVQPGFATGGVLSVEMDLPARYNDDAPLVQFYRDLEARLRAIPGVRGVGVVNNLPLSGQGWTSWLTIENQPRPQGEPPEVGYRSVSAGYFAAMQILLLEGRGFDDRDTADAMKVVVVNKALVDRFFPEGHAVGSRIRLGPNPKAAWRTIVGVVGNIYHKGPETPPDPEAFNVLTQDASSGTVVVRAASDEASLVADVKAVTRSIDPAVVVYKTQWLDALMDEHLAPRRLSLRLVEGFAAIALGLALLGIYGVVSYTVAQRLPEIGVRMALGASPSEIHRMVLGDGLRLAVPGLVAGAVAAALAARVARSVLFGVSPWDPVAFVSVFVLVLGVSAVACYVPARRAARVDPLRTIRAE
jgi:predicted permease